MNEEMRVVNADLIEVGIEKVLFRGTRDQCLAWMRRNRRRNGTLMYANGRLASYVL